MSVIDILNVTLPTFITIFIGYIFGKAVKIDMSGVVDIVYYVGLPALVFVSILDHPFTLLDAVKVWISVVAVTAGCLAVAWILFKILKTRHTGLYLPISLPNTVNIPFPIISLAYGPSGLFAATLYYIPNVFLIYSLGVFVAAGGKWQHNLMEMLKIPAIYAAILALVLNLSHITVPGVIFNSLDFIGGMVTPAVVLILGYSLSKVKITSLPTTILASLIRMGIGLALGFLMADLFHMTGVLRSVVILVSAMPAAVNTYMVAEKYKSESELVASVVLVTTIISLFSIPVLLKVLG